MRAYGEWYLEAKCRILPEVREEFLTESRKARKNCIDCPVKSECLEYAILYNEHGVWGGTTEIERDRVIKGSPRLSLVLRKEALALGILEQRYSIVQYWETIQKARSMKKSKYQYAYFGDGDLLPKAQTTVDHLSEIEDPEQYLKELSKPPEELSTLSEFECAPNDLLVYAEDSM